MNKVIMVGRFVKDTELKYSATGTAIANNTLAVEDGSKENKKSYFFNVVAFKGTAETLAEWSFKGQRVVIEGKLTQRNYDSADGKKVYLTEILLNTVTFLERKKTPEFDAPKAISNEFDIDDMPF